MLKLLVLYPMFSPDCFILGPYCLRITITLSIVAFNIVEPVYGDCVMDPSYERVCRYAFVILGVLFRMFG